MFKPSHEDMRAFNNLEIPHSKAPYSTSVLWRRLYLRDNIISTPTYEERSYQEDRNCREDQPKHAYPYTNAYADLLA
jgi:hypothetical protein